MKLSKRFEQIKRGAINSPEGKTSINTLTNKTLDLGLYCNKYQEIEQVNNVACDNNCDNCETFRCLGEDVPEQMTAEGIKKECAELIKKQNFKSIRFSDNKRDDELSNKQLQKLILSETDEPNYDAYLKTVQILNKNAGVVGTNERQFNVTINGEYHLLTSKELLAHWTAGALILPCVLDGNDNFILADAVIINIPTNMLQQSIDKLKWRKPIECLIFHIEDKRFAQAFIPLKSACFNENEYYELQRYYAEKYSFGGSPDGILEGSQEYSKIFIPYSMRKGGYNSILYYQNAMRTNRKAA